MSAGAGDDPGQPPGWLRSLADAIARDGLGHPLRAGLPNGATPRPSAVLIALAEAAEGPRVLLLQRADALRRHPGQVAFPGGAIDPGDASEVAAALRETQEEVGLDPSFVRPLATAPALYIPHSGFLVTPVLAWWHTPALVAPVDTAEVARVSVVPVGELADPANRFRVRHPTGIIGPGFAVDGLFVWGFTAMLLDRLLELGGWSRDWDRALERALPAELSGRPGTG